MIPVSLPWLILGWLLLCLAGILTLWISFEMGRRKRERLIQKHRIQCNICYTQYEDYSNASVLTCPRCGSSHVRAPAETL